MSDSNSPLLPHGGYEHLRSYKVAQAVYDATVVFCDRFVDQRSRTHDQMVQAARSGVRNISEGSGAAATSRKSEMMLTNVARASLSDELVKDFESFLVQRNLRVWPKDAPETLAMRERLKHDVVPGLPPALEGTVRLTGLLGLADFVATAEPEVAANAMLCATHQAVYLLRRQLESQGRDFVEHGGFAERLHSVRMQARGGKMSGPPAPACPLCGKAMRQRMAKKGPHAEQPFWGCSGYPECKGTRDVSDPSDASDKQVLRQQAEDRLAQSPDIPETLSPDEGRDTLHELRVHQIELEMQNEELRRAQAEIEAGRARYFDLYDLAPVGYCTLSEQGLILEANLTAATLLGAARSALAKRPLSPFILKDDQDVYYLHRKKLFETGEPQACELRLVKPDGMSFWAYLTATAAQAEDGAPVCRVAIIDISERKRAEQDLFAMAERYRLANKATNDVVWDWDIAIDAQRWNESGAAVFGWTDIVAAPQTAAWWSDRIHPEDRPRVDRMFQAAVGNPAVARWNDEYRFRKADGTYAYVVDRGHFLRDAAGRAVRMIGAMLDSTERKDAEEELRRSRQLLVATEALSAVGGWEWDVPTQVMTWTDGTYRIHDLDAVAVPAGSPEHIERSLACYDPGDRPRVEAAFHRCVEAGESYDLECGFTTAKGRRLCVRTLGRAIREGGRTVKVLGNLQDITEQKKAKADSDALPRLLQHLNAGVVIHAADTRILFANETASRLLGLTLDQMLGKTAIDPAWSFVRVDGTPMPLAEYPVNRILATHQFFQNQVLGINRPATRDRVWVLVNAYPEFDDARQLGRIVVAFNDITERKLAEEAAKEASVRLALATRAGGVGVWEYDIANNRLLWEEQMYALYGINRETFDGAYKSWRAGVHPEDIARSDREVEMALRGEKDFDTEFRVVWPDGTVRHIQALATVLRDADGKPRRMIGTNWDITERKRAEAEREKLQNQLQQAQKLESVGRLAGGVAHDFNNMLQSILGHAELMQMKGLLSPDLRMDLGQIRKAAQRSAELTRQLLGFARKQPIMPKILDINQAVDGLLTMLRRLLGEDIELVWKPGPGPLVVKIDPTQVDQILVNLALNARDAIKGNGRILLETRQERWPVETGGSCVCLRISDNGCGMSPEVQAQILEPFFTTKPLGKGTGLGLPMVYGMVKQNQGDLTFSSEVGKGSVFTVFLPQVQPESVEPTVPVSQPDSPGGRESVLVVEDEPSIRASLVRFLESLGYTACSADTPEQALAMLKNPGLGIALMITDVVMPGMSGVELVSKATSLCPGLKALYISGYAEGDLSRRGIVDTKTPFLSKPFTRDQLAHKVREALTDAGKRPL